MPSEDSQRLLELFQRQEQLVKQYQPQTRAQPDGASPRIEPQSDTAEAQYEWQIQSYLLIAEELLLVDSNLCLIENVDERLWNNAYYRRIEILRRRLHRCQKTRENHKVKMYLERLNNLLDQACGFYQWMVEHIHRQLEMPIDKIGVQRLRGRGRSTSQLESYGSCMQRCYVYLGDLSRYRLTLMDSKLLNNPERLWRETEQWYAKASWCAPNSGKAYGQLAIVANSRQYWLDVVYWNCLSLSTAQPSVNARDNLYSFYNKLQQDKIDLTFNYAGTDLTLIKSFIQWHAAVANSESLDTATAVDSLLNKALSPVIEWLDSCYKDAARANYNDTNAKQQIAFKMLAICLGTMWYLQKDIVRYKDRMHRIRQAQKDTFQFAISFQVKIIEWMHTLLSYEADKKEDTTLYWLMSPLTASLVIWCDFCTSHLELIGQLVMLSKPTTGGQSSSSSSNRTIFWPFFQALAKWLNAVKNKVENVNSVKNALPEDWMLWGTLPLRAKQRTLEFNLNYRRTPAAMASVRLARIQNAVQLFAACDSFPEIEWSPQTGMRVKDEESKRQEKERLMQTLAAERLREQVNSLQASLGEIHIDSRRRIAVVDLDALLWHEPLVRRWFQHRLCRVMVPLNVIEQLDNLKKGNQRENSAARDVIRMLDRALLRKDSGIVTQDARHQLNHWQDAGAFMLPVNSNESAICNLLATDDDVFGSIGNDMYVTSHDGGSTQALLEAKTTEPVIDYAQLMAKPTRLRSMELVPRQFRPILGCCLWYLQEAGVKAEMSQDVRALLSASVILVTGNSSLSEYASWFGIQTATPQEWDTLME
ncbi:hypothetical protein BDF22DRAFT_276672 [Syncephalis plumigaleata]|nr:hypothetical protein BDF22DRAFT_276672 [Syncephalis plumigaleata]